MSAQPVYFVATKDANNNAPKFIVAGPFDNYLHAKHIKELASQKLAVFAERKRIDGDSDFILMA
ncbi:hypothetical protein ATO7_12108 [Oceanococcus atlanticus]|uniref:Uncharacterized protein n=1 Tax=Oceanococcus atlanticus TaxID=1317117 RepID=A0A1Y1SBL9_9GAMM|nr:hypothetical protein [Oceanococcus atlanticus]ORE86037.1 hypothetical protein ATO7_12108 [Oceanococcus atlanticus]